MYEKGKGSICVGLWWKEFHAPVLGLDVGDVERAKAMMEGRKSEEMFGKTSIGPPR